MECEALAALQAHLAQAVALRHPHMTSAAMALLSAYFSMIRRAEESPQVGGTADRRQWVGILAGGNQQPVLD